MINFQQVGKRFGAQSVLEDASFQVNPGEHVGIVGPNGAGKSTVFNLIIGEMEPDKGRVEVPTRLRIGYVHQQLDAHKVTATLLEYSENALPELNVIQAEIHELEAGLHGLPAGASDEGGAGGMGQEPGAPDALTPPRDPPGAGGTGTPSRAAVLRRLGDLQHRFEHLGGYTLKSRAEQTLGGLGFPIDWFSMPFKALSGGWQSRAELARVLVAEPDVLLLDEPSNYLDIPAVEWLQRYLKEFKGTLLLISHDRFLLNSLTTVTIEIANSRAERYPGNYDYYARERALRREQRLAAIKNQDRKREKVEKFIERFRAKNTKAAQVQSRIKQLERLEEVELPREVASPGRIRLRAPPHCGAEVVRLEGAGLTYDGQRWVLRGLDVSINRGDKIALVGYNGLGKTTLLRMLAGNLPVSEGKWQLGHRVVVGYQSQDFAETMDPGGSVFGTVKGVAPDFTDQEVRTLLGGFGFSGDAVDKTVSVLSGGEKIRLAFARLLAKPPNFLVLDEPTTHLDIQARESLEVALQEYQGTLCLVSHDIDFVRHVANGIIAMTPPGIARYPGGYDYYHQKTEESGASRPTAAAGKKDDRRAGDPADDGRPTVDKKELRRQRAQARQDVHERTKELKKEVVRAEKQIEVYEVERKKLVQQLDGDPTKLDFMALSLRLKFIQDEIERYTRKWEQASLDLEKAMSG